MTRLCCKNSSKHQQDSIDIKKEHLKNISTQQGSDAYGQEQIFKTIFGGQPMGNKSLLSKGRKHHNTAAQESITSTWEPVETQTARKQCKEGAQQIRLWQATTL